jgi:hypothetical protein
MVLEDTTKKCGVLDVFTKRDSVLKDSFNGWYFGGLYLESW